MAEPQEYHTMIRSLIVKPRREQIFSEMATEIRIEDDGGGMFIEIKQNGRNDIGKICIDISEWETIKQAVEQMITVVKDMEAAQET